MFLHDSQHTSIYFGSAQDQIYPQEYLTTPADLFFAKSIAIQNLKNKWQLHGLFFAHQVHGVAGIQVTSQLLAAVPAFTYQADFLHTSLVGVGIGVMTADCLPIVLIDSVRKAVAVVHAGWSGAVAGIVPAAVQQMHAVYGTKPQDIQAFFGPSARNCCYEVGQEFVALIDPTLQAQGVLELRAQKLFLNVPSLVRNQLVEAGVGAQAIYQEYTVCTMCDTRFFSHRRQAAAAGRQMTVVAVR